jgi:hypothetical protein
MFFMLHKKTAINSALKHFLRAGNGLANIER